MMKTPCLAIFLKLLLCVPSAWATEETDVLLEAVRDGQAAIRAWTFERITNAASAIAAAPVADDEAVFQRDYWKGCLLFHAVVFLREERDKGREVPDADPYREPALEALSRTVKSRPETANAHAMISVLNGMAIDEHPWSAIWRGPALLKHKNSALEHGPQDPRTTFLMGVSTFKRSDGDPDEIRSALATLEQALALFDAKANAASSPWEPRWGRDHTLLFLGRVEEALGRYDRARIWYEKAMNENKNLSSAAEGFERCKNQTVKQ
jgi:tetratricopeptide (TPR) repeat protein